MQYLLFSIVFFAVVDIINLQSVLWIRATDFRIQIRNGIQIWIRIRMLLRILPFSSMTSKKRTKSIFFLI